MVILPPAAVMASSAVFDTACTDNVKAFFTLPRPSTFTCARSKVHSPAPAASDEHDYIVVAHDLSPADMILFKQHQFGGFVTDLGGDGKLDIVTASTAGTVEMTATASRTDWKLAVSIRKTTTTAISRPAIRYCSSIA